MKRNEVFHLFIGDEINEHRILERKSEGKRPLRRLAMTGG
jgi:hypothetical protein